MSAPNQSRLFDAFGLPAKQVEPHPSPAPPVFRNSTPIVADRDPEGSCLAAEDYEQSGHRRTAKGALT